MQGPSSHRDISRRERSETERREDINKLIANEVHEPKKKAAERKPKEYDGEDGEVKENNSRVAQIEIREAESDEEEGEVREPKRMRIYLPK